MKNQRVKEIKSRSREAYEQMRKSWLKCGFGKKIIGMALATCMLVGCLTGCGGTEKLPISEGDNVGNANVETDENKTQLTVATFDGGLGAEWILEAAKRFEKQYADVSFEEGKVGVQVSVIKNSMYFGGKVLSSMQNEVADVWFIEGVDYYDHVNAGNFADITDIVTEKLTKYDEDGSIEDKIDKSFRDYLNAGTGDKPEYYAIPFYDSLYGLTYDRDIFEEYNLYFKTSGTEAGDAADSLNFVSSGKDKKSAGVDGKYGTYDDGLPATYAQFLKMMKKMVENEITPFIYAGSNAILYPLRTMANFLAQAEGAEGYRLNVTFDGTADNLVKLDSNGKVVMGADGKPQLESVKITAENGYELQRQVSRYNLLQFFYEILSDSKNYSPSNFIHTGAQTNFLKGKTGDYDKYGMLIDGAWWTRESGDSFNALAQRYGDEYLLENRNIAFMPIPVATAEDVGKGNTLISGNSSLAFVRSTTKIMDCAKAFLQFTTTDAELSAFTASVNMTRGFNHKITKEYEDKLSPFARSVYELKSGSTVIYPYDKEGIYRNNMSLLDIENWCFSTNMNGMVYNNPWEFWIGTNGGGSVNTYFEGMYKYQKTQWQTTVR